MKSDVFKGDRVLDLNTFQDDTIPSAAVAMSYQRAQPFIHASIAAGTRRVYAAAWRHWSDWCRWSHTMPVPANPMAVAGYLAEQARAGRSLSRVNVLLAAIKHGHRSAGHSLDCRHPAIASTVAGIARSISAPIKQATPLEIGDLNHIIACIAGSDLRALRDRAVILLGFHAALRRSELISLDVKGRSYVEVRPEGLLIHLTATKTANNTQTIAISKRGDALCAVAAFLNYLAAAKVTSGPLFRAVSKAGRLLNRRLDSSSVSLILRARAARSPQIAKAFSAHSLRSGFATSAAKAGAPEFEIQRTTRHRSVIALRGYIRVANAFEAAPDRWLVVPA